MKKRLKQAKCEVCGKPVPEGCNICTEDATDLRATIERSVDDKDPFRPGNRREGWSGKPC